MQMKKLYLCSVVVLLGLFMAALAFANVPVINPVPEQVGYDLIANYLFQGIGGLKGAGGLAIAFFVVQGLMLLARTPLADFAGKWKLVIVAVTTLAATFLALMLAGATWSVALLSGAFLTMFQTYLNQIWKQFFTDKGNVTPAEAAKG
jgi:hypothetical protein